MSLNVTTAVIFASGFGSRMLPVTAAVQKELLPILDRPVIDYVVSDCIAAGVTNIIFVVRPGSRGLQNYYLGNQVLEAHLRRQGKDDALAELAIIHNQAKFSFVEQPDDAGYGTAVPLRVAAPYLPQNEAFLVCGGDDFLWREDGDSEIARFIQTFQDSGADGAVMALEKDEEQLHRYGVLEITSADGHEYLRAIIEKPAPGTAPSNTINISKYILTPQLLEYVMQVTPNPKSGEYYVTDAVTTAALHHRIAVHRAGGAFLDAGNVESWLEANLTVAKNKLQKTYL